MNVKQLNYSLFKAAEHLSEAGKFLMVLDQKRGLELLQEADAILSIIKPEKEKMSTELLDSIMAEIINLKLEL